MDVGMANDLVVTGISFWEFGGTVFGALVVLWGGVSAVIWHLNRTSNNHIDNMVKTVTNSHKESQTAQLTSFNRSLDDHKTSFETTLNTKLEAIQQDFDNRFREFTRSDNEHAEEIKALWRDFNALRQELPEKYLRQEDNIRQQLQIGDKLDKIGTRLNKILEQGKT